MLDLKNDLYCKVAKICIKYFAKYIAKNMTSTSPYKPHTLKCY